jgi:hypothetical protein
MRFSWQSKAEPAKPAPSVSNDFVIAAVPMTSTGSVRPPALAADWTVTAVPMTATGRMLVPAVSPAPTGATTSSSLLLIGVGT